MKVHTSLTLSQIYRLMDADDRLRDVLANVEQVGSRTHANGFHIKLYSYLPTSSVNGAKRKRPMGHRLGDTEYAATFDEWGYWFAALFEADPTARCGGTVALPEYANREHFHERTSNAYRPVVASQEA